MDNGFIDTSVQKRAFQGSQDVLNTSMLSGNEFNQLKRRGRSSM